MKIRPSAIDVGMRRLRPGHYRDPPLSFKSEFKYNNRALTDGERTVNLIQAVDQRRLSYVQQTAKNRDVKGRYRGPQ